MIKPDTKVTIAIDFDLAALSHVPDARLAMLWHVAQANPAPHGDEQAGETVRKIGQEIVRRWLASTGPEMYHHQARDYYWHHLGRFASHRDGDWRPDPEKIAKYEAEQATSTALSSGEYLYCGASLSHRPEYPLTCHRRIGHDGPCSRYRDKDTAGGEG
ncbi:hypothetical protein ACW4TU_18670 [Streptomyces sp. QTS52]